MCPIVSACGTARYNTAKFITKIFQNYSGKTSSFVKDSTDFIKKIKYLSINQEEETLVSFDVSALFTSIPVKEALYIHIKDPSLNRNIGKVRIPSVFNKLLKFPRQLECPHSSIPHPRGHLLYLVFQHKRQLTLHTFLISIYNRSVIPMFMSFKLQDN